ncbi:MAG TPA: carboxylesterase family protein, partial [Streptosporangiaceae bacterium]
MAADVVALTVQGRLRGARDGPALRFLGIPFAESPVTAGRFGAPAAPGRWDGIRDALSYGATSPQPDRGVTLIPEPIIAGDNELNLNVFTPDLGPARLPVLVWIHGGGFFGGCNASPWYRGGPSPTGRSGSRPSDWPWPRPKRAARPGPTTSAGR